MNYQKNKNWRVYREGDRIIISWWQDMLYFMDEIDSTNIEAFLSIYNAESINSSQFDSQFADISKKLLNAGILYIDDRKDSKNKKIQYKIQWCWDKNEILEKSLEQELNKSDIFSSQDTNIDIIIYIRTNSLLHNCIDTAYKHDSKSPHILIDLANHHTISFGPYVKFGSTSCLGCLIWKIQYHWGDVNIPESPKVTLNTWLISHLLKEFLVTFRDIWSCPNLVNNTISWNLDKMTLQHESIFQLPWCPFCWYESQEASKNKYWSWSFEIPWSF